MRHAPRALTPVFPLAGLMVAFAAHNGWTAADSEVDKYEERAIAHGIERAMRSVKSDRALWVKELETAYPGRVTNALTEDDYASWFALLAAKGEEWRKDSAANAQIAELFERIVQRLELGPVPSIKRDEFARYARKALIPGNPPKDGTPPADQYEDADKVFRVLDRDGDGSLDKEELTLHLRDDRIRADADGNGRISKDEYRLYFQRRVTLAVETASAKGNEKGQRGLDPKTSSTTAKVGVAMPDWFTTLDADMDGQIALHEWRKAGRSIETYMEMDLDEDGLLTRDEYLRFVKKNELERVKAASTPTTPMMGKQAMK
jgi:Ca2+-binding EF-hand superfamily protein